MARFVAICVLALIAFTLSAEAELVLRPQFDSIRLWNDDKILNHTITLDNDMPGINFTIDTFQDVQDVDFTVTLKAKDAENSDYYIKGKASLNLCQILALREQSTIGRILFHYLGTFGPIIDTCPIKAGSYYIRNIWYPEDPALNNAPENSFQIDLECTAILASGRRVRVIRDSVKGRGVLKNVAKRYTGSMAIFL